MPDLIENCYSIDGSSYRGNKFDYLASRLKKGQPVKYKKRVLFNDIFDFCWFYDGIIAYINNGELNDIVLFLDNCDEIEKLEDFNKCNLPMMWEDGI